MAWKKKVLRPLQLFKMLLIGLRRSLRKWWMPFLRWIVGLQGSSAGESWLDMIRITFDEGTSSHRFGSRQLEALSLECDIELL
uniref:Uncharacterized protein n=1 Tax=Lactuca sativa TaxID=4236 RepID=A0A9R1XST3_LACSA|nr:hypothetical protein LSAT_V11C100011540 [Lactuca sativa]